MSARPIRRRHLLSSLAFTTLAACALPPATASPTPGPTTSTATPTAPPPAAPTAMAAASAAPTTAPSPASDPTATAVPPSPTRPAPTASPAATPRPAAPSPTAATTRSTGTPPAATAAAPRPATATSAARAAGTTQPNITIRRPTINTQLTSPARVEGTARVFEAALEVEILDGSGAVVGKKSATASAGAPTFGTYAVDIPFRVTTAQNGSVRAFSYSPRDGVRENVVSLAVRLIPPTPTVT